MFLSDAEYDRLCATMNSEQTTYARRFPRESLLQWWEREKRDLPWRSDPSPWRTWVSEVMLQQTRVETVIPYFHRFMRRFPNPEDLARADMDNVLKLWEGLGYYQRVRNLARAARMLVESNHGVIPSNPADFARLPGVGDYIQAAVMSIAFGRPFPAVDGNVKRVVARYRGDFTDIRGSVFIRHVRRVLERVISPDRPGDFNESMMELGALVCLPRNPKCGVCPLSGACRARALGLTDRLPVRAPRPRPPLHEMAAGVVIRDGRILVRRRPAQGLLGGLWEFPGGRVPGGESPAQTVKRICREDFRLEVNMGDRVAEVSHAYTHFRIHMSVFLAQSGAGPHPAIKDPEAMRWILPSELSGYPFPTAHRKAFPAILARLASGDGL